MSWDTNLAQVDGHPLGMNYDQIKPDCGYFIVDNKALYITTHPGDLNAWKDRNYEHFERTGNYVLTAPAERMLSCALLELFTRDDIGIINTGSRRLAKTRAVIDPIFGCKLQKGKYSEVPTGFTMQNGRKFTFYPSLGNISTGTGDITLPSPSEKIVQLLSTGLLGSTDPLSALQQYLSGDNLDELQNKADLKGIFDINKSLDFVNSNLDFIKNVLGLDSSRELSNESPVKGAMLATEFGTFTVSTALVATGLLINVWMGYLTQTGLGAGWNYVDSLKDSITPETIAIAIMTGAGITATDRLLVEKWREKSNPQQEF